MRKSGQDILQLLTRAIACFRRAITDGGRQHFDDLRTVRSVVRISAVNALRPERRQTEAELSATRKHWVGNKFEQEGNGPISLLALLLLLS